MHTGMKTILILTLASWLSVPVALRAQSPAPPPPPPPVGGVRLLAQAYPCATGSYPSELTINELACFRGRSAEPAGPGAVPGILSLARRGLELDVNCFVVSPPNATGPCRVQSYRLIKANPYQGVFIQFGKDVRTWWSLNFTPPGTTFTLIIDSVCPVTGPTPLLFKRDIYVWRVIAYPPTMLRLIDLMHTSAVGTLEVPCILSEETYDCLVALVRLLDEVTETLSEPPTLGELLIVRDVIFELELFLLVNCLSIDIAYPVLLFPGAPQFEEPAYQPPGNLSSLVFVGEGGAFGGILDTVENPCCSILLADLDFIAGFFDISLGLDLPRLGGSPLPLPDEMEE
jgi:hypothetical protein